ncbi:MAG: tyrosine-type recombinase/integrase [Pseudomonadota bacterium]
MASISLDRRSGRRTIQFVGHDRKRRSIRLGKVSRRFAEAAKVRIEELVTAKSTSHPPREDTLRWVAEIDEQIHGRLVATGLVQPRAATLLGDFLEEYIDGRRDVKAGTKTVYGHTQRNLIDHFGSGVSIRDITPGHADEWRRYLVELGLSDNTVRRRSGIAKQFFTAAVRKKLITENPFADLPASVRANPKRFHFISTEDAQKVLDACPDAQWRLLFALSRFAGLRCPSEHLRLRWADIDWREGRMTINSSKTEHHEDGGVRQVPIFPEVFPHLREVFESAEPGAEYVITRYRKPNANLRTQLMKIIKRAGLEPWPKLFQNLRSSCETALAEKFPMHVVTAWIGNSEAVAVKHYLQVTDDHFRRATEAVQNPVQQSAASTCSDSQVENSKSPFEHSCGDLLELAAECESAVEVGMGEGGFEPP